MNVQEFLNELRNDPSYADQIVYVRIVEPRKAVYIEPATKLSASSMQMLESKGISKLFSHQAQAVDLATAGKNVVVATGTASGKSLCYQLPLLELLAREPDAKAILMFPTKALCQDQFRSFNEMLTAAGMTDVMAGVFDGDTPSNLRRRLRDEASVLFTNPDMLHAAVMPQHGRWASFLSKLQFIVMDELHTYSGIFGANMANLMRRTFRLCDHYRSDPQLFACSATIANPKQLAETLTGRDFALVDSDGSPSGKRFYVLWNPQRLRNTNWRSRRSANVEAHELMARLITRGVSTITFSKSKMSAEMIHRYVDERLGETAPHLRGKISPYRGGYRPHERREIERQLFNGELLGVSTTRALELGIDVGDLEACIVVGYPGTLASFLQQAGRAGRRHEDSLVILIGLDTTVNQFVMTHPEYLFERPVEQTVIDADNPFVITGHLRCATHELPLSDESAGQFGLHANLVLDILQENRKTDHISGNWYHAADETPQHEVSLRDYADANVIIHDADSGEALGEINRLDAPPILHEGAIYMHRGDTYRVLNLDLDSNIATVKREDVDYYTDPLGGTDVHHVDNTLRSKPFGTGLAMWGEVTAYFNTWGYDKIRFYELQAISTHPVNLPTDVLETMAVWLVPPEDLLADVLKAGLQHSGLPGVGYATRMLLPLYITCDTLDFSHSIGSVNSPWQSIFIYERYPHGLGFTEKVYENLHSIVPDVLQHVKDCQCEDGCPCCVGKPLRQYADWYVDRHEAWVPSKASTLMILEGLIGDASNLGCADIGSVSESPAAAELRLQQALRRRLERMREPKVFHPIEPIAPQGYRASEQPEDLKTPDVTTRRQRRGQFDKSMRKRLAQKLESRQLDALTSKSSKMKDYKHGKQKPPTHFSGMPQTQDESVSADQQQNAHTPKTPDSSADSQTPRKLGDSLAARAMKRKKKPGKEDQQ